MKIYLIFVALLLTSCGGSIALKTSDPATVSVLDWDSLSSKGSVIGKSPIEFEQDKVENKVMKIEAEGKLPQYWIFTNINGSELELQTTLLDAPKEDGESSEDKKEAEFLNRNLRLLLNSYESLVSNDFEAAKKIAKSLQENIPNIAAPHIIIGLANLREGNRSAANSAFKVAKSLDPSDTAIEKLIEISK